MKAVRNLGYRNLQSLRLRNYYQACQCMPETSFNVCTLRLLRVARCFDAWQYVPYLVWQNKNKDKFVAPSYVLQSIEYSCVWCNWSLVVVSTSLEVKIKSLFKLFALTFIWHLTQTATFTLTEVDVW